MPNATQPHRAHSKEHLATWHPEAPTTCPWKTSAPNST